MAGSRLESDVKVHFSNRPFRRFLRPSPIFTLALVLGLVILFWPARALRSDNFVLYMPNARHVIPLEAIASGKYLPLLQVLNIVGKVDALQEKRNSLKVWFGEAEIELRLDDKKVRVNKSPVTLPHPVRVAKGQWMVPVDFLTAVLPRVTRQAIEYQMGTNRMFIGDVKPSSFTVRLDQIPNGARLTVQFTDRVTVRTAASDGKWCLYLGERPVEPLEPTFRFQDPYVSELRFDDQDGNPKLILTPAAGGLNFYPTLAEGGKVLLADVMKPPPPAPPQPGVPPEVAGATPSPPTPPSPAGAEEAAAAPTGPPLPVVVLDAGHGGDDLGARSRDGVLEKDLMAQLVARVRLALLATKKYRVVLTRMGDVNLDFDQRETAVNLARPEAFLTFHAGDLGIRAPQVAIYSYQFPSPAPQPGDEPGNLFVPWARVQQTHLDRSRELARGLQQQFAQVPGLTADPPRRVEAPVRALRSVNAPAVAIEIGTLSPDEDSTALTNPSFLHQVSTAIVEALETFQGRQS